MKLKRIVHTTAHCVDTLLDAAEKKSPETLRAYSEIAPGAEVTIVDGPVTILDSGGGLTEIVKVRYESSTGDLYEGWILHSAIK